LLVVVVGIAFESSIKILTSFAVPSQSASLKSNSILFESTSVDQVHLLNAILLSLSFWKLNHIAQEYELVFNEDLVLYHKANQ